jgi:hypothetical protein
MPIVNINTLGEMAIVECAGRFVRNDAVFKLRDAVTSQTNARVVVLDLTEMDAIGGGGSGDAIAPAEMGSGSRYSIPAIQPLRACARQTEAR